jgi:RHH-type proline utilization regulon transcriptional repressor/proline dehydrogenase/delta 1-pyrroline-5-carboxylate dehydrogenase
VTDATALFAPRLNSRGFDLADRVTLAAIDQARDPFRRARWEAAPMLATGAAPEPVREATSPADASDVVGTVADASGADVAAAVAAARPWGGAAGVPAADRAAVLRRAAELYELAFGEIFALLAREAGKVLPDAVAELREAVDFLRYYAAEAERLAAERPGLGPRGTIACISPWNFPLAIFTGQIAAALAGGNAVLAKPAEATPLIGALGTRLLHEAGVPREALQLLPGDGRVGAALSSAPGVAGVCFTGSTETAQRIHRSMAEHLDPHAMLVAETGGLNAMIVDSTALPEQAVRDIVMSAFRSAGQRCSACRVLYVQEDVAEGVLAMLRGAMDELRAGDPWDLPTDVAPVITAATAAGFEEYVARAEREGRLLHRLPSEGPGHAFGPAAIAVEGIEAVEREVFGPVLHVARFPSGGTDAVVDAINARGYGLTFGLHSRLTDRAERLTSRIAAGNSYVNRNQIGAIVGSQPFGGEGLSGTGPKAGGPQYVARMMRAPDGTTTGAGAGTGADTGTGTGADTGTGAEAGGAPRIRAGTGAEDLAAALARAARHPRRRLETQVMPGPTGEANELSTWPRGPVLCLGPGREAAERQAGIARARGCAAVVPDGPVEPALLADLPGLALVAFDAPDGAGGDAGGGAGDRTEDGGPDGTARALRRALAARPGPIVALARGGELDALCLLERHVCTDTTAAGGNAALIGGS